MDYCRKKVPQIDSLDDLVAEFRAIFNKDQVDVDYVQDVMLSYKSNPKDWTKYAHFDRHRYTRNLVDNGNGKYNLMLIAWSVGQGSGIHDHADAHCFMKVLTGCLTEVRFLWPESDQTGHKDAPMKMVAETELGADEVTYINDSIGLHRMENRSHAQHAVSLHLYIPPFETCKTFDPRSGHSSNVSVTFYSKQGKRTPFTVTSRAGAPGNNSTTQVISYENN